MPAEAMPVSKPITVERMPGHWLLASLGKRVLRPGGLELTRWMLDHLAVREGDRVVEFAPGMGATARRTLAAQPREYVAVEADAAAAARLRSWLEKQGGRVVEGSAEGTQLPGGSYSVVYGEAMLSMHTREQKRRIIAEAARLLRAGGRYGIHELCLVPDGIPEGLQREIQGAMSMQIHVGVQPIPTPEWRTLLQEAGLQVVAEARAPMHLLEPGRMLRDEGVLGALRIACNVARKPAARARVCAMRAVFRRYSGNLQAIAVVAVK